MLSKLSGSIFARSGQVRSRVLLDSAMAAAALSATADGAVSFAKRHRVDEILESVEVLKAFEVHVAMGQFEAFVEELRVRPDQGRARALRAVSAAAGKDESAGLVLRIACAVARADGRYSPDGVARIREISEALGRAIPDLDTGGPGTAEDGSPRALCIVVGNQKGGTGKSTTALHLAVSFLKAGEKVGCIDLDGQQGTLSHYLANRRAYAEKNGTDILMPLCRCIEPVAGDDRESAEYEERALLNDAFTAFADCDYLIIDTPGSHGHLTRLGHINADVLITPINDSLLDVDVLAEIDQGKRQVVGPSPYARMVMEQSDKRVAAGRLPIDWIVMRNRISQLDTRNTREMNRLLGQLSERMGFRLQAGLSERVIYREMFYNGLTLLDLPQGAEEARINSSHWNARREVRELVDAVTA